MSYHATLSSLNLGLINIRAEVAARNAISSALQVPLPETINTLNEIDGKRALMIAPDHWIVISDDPLQHVLVEMINGQVEHFHANATLVSDQYAGYEIGGADILDILSQGCALDLDPEQFKYGQGTICGFAKTKCIIIPGKEALTYQIFVESSLGQYLKQWFEKSRSGSV